MGFLDELYNNHGNDVEGHLSSELGISREKAATVLPKVAPIIMAQLKKRAQERGGEEFEREAEQAHGDLDTDDITAILGRGRDQADAVAGAQPQAGGGMQDLLGSLLGGAHGQQANTQLSNQLGISPGMAAKIIPMIAPLILSALMKSKGQAAGGQAQGGGGGGGGGILTSILDKNGDGSIMDDLLSGGVSSVLGGGGQGAQGAGKSGCLGSIMGLLGGRR